MKVYAIVEEDHIEYECWYDNAIAKDLDDETLLVFSIEQDAKDYLSSHAEDFPTKDKGYSNFYYILEVDVK